MSQGVCAFAFFFRKLVHKPGLMYFLHLVLHQKDPQIKQGPEWQEMLVQHNMYKSK